MAEQVKAGCEDIGVEAEDSVERWFWILAQSSSMEHVWGNDDGHLFTPDHSCEGPQGGGTGNQPA